MADTWDSELPKLGDIFAQNKGTLSPTAIKAAQDQYQGIEGYRRMHRELTQSLYDEMPEMRGRLEIVDHSRPPQEEIQRIAKSLNISSEKVTEIIGAKNKEEKYTGKIKTLTSEGAYLDDGSYICIASDLPLYKKDLSFSEIKTYARFKIHETMHCLDEAFYTPQNGEKSIYAQYGHSRAYSILRAWEMFADTGAQSLMLKNGDSAESTLELITDYDLQKPILYYDEPNDERALRYDNGNVLRALLHTEQGGAGLTGFYMKGWKEAAEQADHLRKQTSNLESQNIARDIVQNRILVFVYKRLASNSMADIQDDEKHWKSAGYDDLEEAFNTHFTEGFFVKYKNGEFKNDPQANRILEAALKVHGEFTKWLEENADMIPGSERILAGQKRVLNGYEGDVDLSIKDKPLSALQILGYAALKMYEQPDSLLAKEVFEAAMNSIRYFTMDSEDLWLDNLEATRERLTSDPNAARRLIKGESFETLSEPEQPAASETRNHQPLSLPVSTTP